MRLCFVFVFVILLALLCVMISCVFATFPYGALGKVMCLVVSIPDLCLFHYLKQFQKHAVTSIRKGFKQL